MHHEVRLLRSMPTDGCQRSAGAGAGAGQAQAGLGDFFHVARIGVRRQWHRVARAGARKRLGQRVGGVFWHLARIGQTGMFETCASPGMGRLARAVSSPKRNTWFNELRLKACEN